MKKYFALLFILGLTSCNDLEVLETAPINLGTESTQTRILTAIPTGNKLTVTYHLTVGAKYSTQIYEFAASEPKKTFPLTANEEIIIREYDISDLPNGIYDITLTDTKGTSIRKPLIIK